ncbi:MAG: DUF2318 domain-containing protein [Spirochaetales bacterium]|jgi:uncharacterized membrane protein|nr:DUF2318 domain-containing protein [Spirochaetales bacterium]
MGTYQKNKKALVLAKQKRRRRGLIIIPAVAVIVTIGLVFIFQAEQKKQNAVSTPLSDAATFGGNTAKTGNRIVHEKVTAVNGVITLNAADYSDGKAAYFTTKAGGKTVDFFVLESSDGVIRAAFDACDVCYQAKKGYRQSGDLMICNNCGQRFPSELINVEKGGCNPSPLDRHHENGVITIALEDITSGAKYF